MRCAVTLIVSAFALLGAAPAVAQPIVNEQLLRLEATESTVSGMAGPTTSSGTALDGKSYVVRVTGAYGAYDRRLMLERGPFATGWQLCGQRVGARGQDAEFIWGLPVPAGVFCPALPISHGNLVIDAGAGFTDYDPVQTLPEPTNLATSNRYEYLVTPTNGDALISVGLLDSNLTDNVGALRVRVRSLRARNCEAGGWAFFGDAFASEADCLSQVP